MEQVELSEEKRACLVYVAATEAGRHEVRARLEGSGYTVCEVKVELDVAIAAQAGETALPAALVDCISGSSLCIFLLPEMESDDCILGDAAGLSNQLGKRTIGIVAGARTKYPPTFEDQAESMLRLGSERLADAISGIEIWEKPDRSIVSDRTIDHIRCQ